VILDLLSQVMVMAAIVLVMAMMSPPHLRMDSSMVSVVTAISYIPFFSSFLSGQSKFQQFGSFPAAECGVVVVPV